MKPPVEHVRVSAKAKDLLIKIKRNTGLEHWNEICRIALCQSLANRNPPQKFEKELDSNIDIEWKTFAGDFSNEISALFWQRVSREAINIADKSAVSFYFKSHLERGISSLQNVKSLNDLLNYIITSSSSAVASNPFSSVSSDS